MVIDGPLYKFIKISWLLVLISNNYMYDYLIIDKQKNDDNTIIAIEIIDIISIFTINCPSLFKGQCSCDIFQTRGLPLNV